jgi:DNA-binding NarL/FixJ family response regulator
MAEKNMKVLLIDDHPLILSAIRHVIRDLSKDVVVVGVESAVEARSALRREPNFDLLLLDLNLGDIPGFDLLAELRACYPAIPVVVISGSERASDVIQSIDGGAMGFVPKRASTELLFEALHLVISGGIYVPPMAYLRGDSVGPPLADVGPLSNDSQTAVVDFDVASASAPAPPRSTPPAGTATAPLSVEGLGLTTRQCEVLTLLLQGKANKVIARELNLSVETVKDHVAAVLRSLGVNSRTQAVLAVSQLQEGGRQALRPVRG